jgi:hypothetical protein
MRAGPVRLIAGWSRAPVGAPTTVWRSPSGAVLANGWVGLSAFLLRGRTNVGAQVVPHDSSRPVAAATSGSGSIANWSSVSRTRFTG